MANEFIARNGIFALSDSQVTGSLKVSNGITGSLFGTSSWAVSASNALTASFLGSTTNAFLQNGNSFGTTALLGTNDNQSLALETNGSTKMFISSSGNVGLNTSAPDTKLHIEDVTKVLTGNVSGVAQGTLALVTTDAQAADIGGSLIFGGNYINASQTRIAYAGIAGRKSNSTSINADGYLSFLTWRSTGLTEAMRITAAGSVGINTTSPTLGTLQVNGNVHATSYTGSLFGTSSWAVNSVTSSYPLKVSGSSIFSTHTDSAAGGTNASTTHSIFIGRGAGDGATTANNSTFIGYAAGQSATNANNSTFIGNTVGVTATNAYNSFFFGTSAGYAAGNANDSNFFGASAGGYATSASFSNFIGNTAGNKAASASYSNLIGFHAGYNPSFAAGTGIKSNNIIIGTNITLPDGTQDSVNIGGIIFATGSYATTAGNPYSGSVNTGRVGIGKVTPSVTLDISGSTTVTGSLNVSQGITGSLFGTASWAVSASWAPGGGGSSITVQDEGSTLTTALTSLNFVGSGVAATNSGGAVTVTIAGAGGSAFPYTGSAEITGSLRVTGPLFVTGSDAIINSITVGRGAGNFTTNTVIGSGSLINNTTGEQNTAIGSRALRDNSTGNGNVAVGSDTGILVTTGNYNTLIGNEAGRDLTTGDSNTLIGNSLKYNPAGSAFNGSYTLGIGKFTSSGEGRLPHIWAPAEGSVTNGGTGTLLRLDPGKYSGFFIEYVIDDTGGNMRSGTLKGIFKGDMSAIQWAEVDALTIGNTSAAIFTVVDSGTGYLDVLLDNNIGSTIYHSFTSRLILRN